MEISEKSPSYRESMYSPADSPARIPAQQRLFTGDETDSEGQKAGCGLSTSGLSQSISQGGSSLRTSQAYRRGVPKSRDVWRGLSMWCPELTSRLGMLVLRIFDGECSLLPTVTARDWRSPGSSDHARLQASRGEPLTETIGCRLSPEFCEWMMGFPVGFTDVSESLPSETPYVQPSPNGSGAK